MSAAGLKPKVNIPNGMELEGPRHTHNSTILLLKDAHSPRNFDWPPEVHTLQHRKAISPHPITTHFLQHPHSLPHPTAPPLAIPPGPSSSFRHRWRRHGKGHMQCGTRPPLLTWHQQSQQVKHCSCQTSSINMVGTLSQMRPYVGNYFCSGQLNSWPHPARKKLHVWLPWATSPSTWY